MMRPMYGSYGRGSVRSEPFSSMLTLSPSLRPDMKSL